MSRLVTVSYCIGAYNEEIIIIKKIDELLKNLTKIVGKNNFEVVIVENGSSDSTQNLLKRVKDKRIRSYFIRKKGHGLALRTAVSHANNDYCMITGMDLPFGFDDLKKGLKLIDRNDIIFGSKAHPKSKIGTSLKRKLASQIFRYLQRILFDLSIGDSQGSLLFERKKVSKLLNLCDADDSFFTSQIAIYAKLKGFRMVEIPVTLTDENNRSSKINLISDGFGMLNTMLTEYTKYQNVKKRYD